MTTLRVVLAQLPVRVGDLSGNVERIRAAQDHAEQVHADVLLTPEMSVTGYPVEDLLAGSTRTGCTAGAVGTVACTAGAVAAVGAVLRVHPRLLVRPLPWRPCRDESASRVAPQAPGPPPAPRADVR